MIWLTQVLCPARHCLFGAVWDDTLVTLEEMEQQLEAQFGQGEGKMNRWCGICGSRDVRPQHVAAPHFKTVQEAEHMARLVERKNLESRLVLDLLGLTYDEAMRRLNSPN